VEAHPTPAAVEEAVVEVAEAATTKFESFSSKNQARNAPCVVRGSSGPLFCAREFQHPSGELDAIFAVGVKLDTDGLVVDGLHRYAFSVPGDMRDFLPSWRGHSHAAVGAGA
jgi:hypothetical protein